MDDPQAETITVRTPKPWRRFHYAACADCGWHVEVRAYRSRLAYTARAMTRAGVRHTAETGHLQVRAGVVHA
jgi:hypothetical protein